jgi:hypothetical protein
MIEDSTEWWDLMAFYSGIPSARLATTMVEDSTEWLTLLRLSGAVPFQPAAEPTPDNSSLDQPESDLPTASIAGQRRRKAAPRRRRLEIAVVLVTILMVAGLWVLLPKH